MAHRYLRHHCPESESDSESSLRAGAERSGRGAAALVETESRATFCPTWAHDARGAKPEQSPATGMRASRASPCHMSGANGKLSGDRKLRSAEVGLTALGASLAPSVPVLLRSTLLCTSSSCRNVPTAADTSVATHSFGGAEVGSRADARS